MDNDNDNDKEIEVVEVRMTSSDRRNLETIASMHNKSVNDYLVRSIFRANMLLPPLDDVLEVADKIDYGDIVEGSPYVTRKAIAYVGIQVYTISLQCLLLDYRFVADGAVPWELVGITFDGYALDMEDGCDD